MQLFEMKEKKTSPAETQAIKEEAVKSTLSDESLGLTTDAWWWINLSLNLK